MKQKVIKLAILRLRMKCACDLIAGADGSYYRSLT
jgi:hypothetical protein